MTIVRSDKARMFAFAMGVSEAVFVPECEQALGNASFLDICGKIALSGEPIDLSEALTWKDLGPSHARTLALFASSSSSINYLKCVHCIHQTAAPAAYESVLCRVHRCARESCA